MATFPNTSLRPMAMRAALREVREHGERPVAWGAGETIPNAAASTFRTGVGMIPILGPAAGNLFFRPRRMALLLTDQRLITFAAEAGRRAPPRRLLPDAWLTSLTVRRLGRGRFAAEWPECGREVRVRLFASRGRGPRRLAEAMEALCGG